MIKDDELDWDNEKELLGALSEANLCSERSLNIIGRASQRLRRNKKFMLRAVKTYPSALVEAEPAMRRDKDIVRAAIRHDFELDGALQLESHMEKLDEPLCDDYEFIMSLVSYQPLALSFAGDRLQNNRHLVLAAVSRNHRSIKRASDELQRDPVVVLTALEAAIADAKRSKRRRFTLGFSFVEIERLLFNLCRPLRSDAPVLNCVLPKLWTLEDEQEKTECSREYFSAAALLRYKWEGVWLVSRLTDQVGWGGSDEIHRNILEFAALHHRFGVSRRISKYEEVINFLIENDLRLQRPLYRRWNTHCSESKIISAFSAMSTTNNGVSRRYV
jgi:Domain of unknown function (DUF4116)